MIAAIAILTVTVYATLLLMAMRDRRLNEDENNPAESPPRRLQNCDVTAARRRISHEEAAGARRARGERTEMIPEIRPRTRAEVRQMVRLAIDNHRPPFRTN